MLLVWTFGFGASLAALLLAHRIYRATGPHPHVTSFMRTLKHHVRWLIPGLKDKPNAKDKPFRL
jgi:hypothetical protein